MSESPHRKRMRRIEVPRRARGLNCSCFRGQRFLASERSCRWLADSLTRGLEEHEIDLWAYCFMPTHIHLLVFPRADEPSIAAFLESVKTSVAKKAVGWVRANAPSFLAQMKDVQPNGRFAYRFWQRGGGFDRNLWSRRANLEHDRLHS